MNIDLLSSKYIVRKITENDIEIVLALCEKNPMYYQYCPPKPSVRSIMDDLKALPPNKEYIDKYYVGFFKNEKIVAVMDLIYEYPNDNTVFIGFFMMDSELQGTGIGTSIISYCLNYLQSIGFKKVRLGYVKENNQAKSFWVKNRFLPTGIEDKQELYTVVFMEKNL